ncbi:hypothetical protein CEXT_472891 [Caerostris extrusa]|uniref:Uncharacterized protein n=1 Tax=Caerostris extrusa TaxID=172846 RepID=A0AAV4XB59_CAEEX|nr:hypothetical protein CEXT_472891 [Caerostris extrusa]
MKSRKKKLGISAMKSHEKKFEALGSSSKNFMNTTSGKRKEKKKKLLHKIDESPFEKTKQIKGRVRSKQKSRKSIGRGRSRKQMARKTRADQPFVLFLSGGKEKEGGEVSVTYGIIAHEIGRSVFARAPSIRVK